MPLTGFFSKANSGYRNTWSHLSYQADRQKENMQSKVIKTEDIKSSFISKDNWRYH